MDGTGQDCIKVYLHLPAQPVYILKTSMHLEVGDLITHLECWLQETLQHPALYHFETDTWLDLQSTLAENGVLDGEHLLMVEG